jgi:hypothetical protein
VCAVKASCAASHSTHACGRAPASVINNFKLIIQKNIDIKLTDHAERKKITNFKSLAKTPEHNMTHERIKGSTTM